MENYESLGVIGEGTYGVVMKARHKETGQVVAIKKFKESDEDEQVRKTSLREVRVLKQLRHDNVITLLEVFRRKGKLYLVFEYVEKTILEVLEKKPNGLDEQEVRRYSYQLLRGVEYCHANNIIHRDVKPENILISRNGALKICDFGFARPMSVGGKYTDYVATRWYRCPELLVGDVEYGKGVDVWAIGCIFAEISNGMPLFAGESDPDQLAHIIRCNGKLTSRQTQIFRRNPLYVGVELPPVPPELESLDSRFPNAPKSWLNFLKGCLRNDPDQRETCASLIAMPYFTDRNWRAEYDAELKMIMDKENRSNALKRPSESAPTRAPEISQDLHARPVSMGSQPTEAGEGKIPPVPAKHSPVLPVNGGYPTTSGHPSSHSVWSQFLQSSGPEQAASPPALFPGLSGAKPQAPSPVSSYGGVGHSQSSFLPQAGIHGASKGPPLGGGHSGNSGYPPAPHGYLTTFGHSEPLMVTNSLASKSGQGQAGAGVYGMSSKKAVPISQQTASSPSGTMLPTLGSGGVAGGGLAINPVPAPWSLPSSTPVTSQERSGVTAPAATASQLAYKKKPGKRNVLSTLSLTAFGAQQGMGVDAPAPSAGAGGTFMMHGQSHAMDHPSHGNPSRRGSKPWNG